ncbi:MAG: histidine kinase [Cytophagales bacterium]|nr:histidine kinase [Cytophagales bacterium]
MPKQAWYHHFFALLLFVATGTASAQSSIEIIYTIDDGLPSNTVYDLIQDDRGYMWFGTDAGLSRFDGYEFKNYELSDGLPDMDILKFFKDSSGRIWMYSFNGNMGYVKEDSIFSTANNQLPSALDYNSRITQILEFESKIFISAYHGPIKIFDPVNQTLIEPPIDDLLGTYICKCQESLLGVISRSNRKPAMRKEDVATGLTMVKFNPNPTPNIADFYEELTLNNQVFLRSGLGYFICIDDLLITHSNQVEANGLKILDTRNLTSYLSSTIQESGIRVLSVRTLAGKVLVHTSIGVYEYDPKADQFTLKHEQEGNTSSYVDHEGNIWLTSLKNGVMFKPVNKVKQASLPLPEIDQMTVNADQLILVGQKNRLIFMNSDFEKEKEFILNERAGYKYLNAYEHVVALGSNASFSLLDSRNGEPIRKSEMNVRAVYIKDSLIYIASSRSRVTELDLNSGEEQSFIWTNGRINDLLVRKDSIMMATDRGFFILDKQFNIKKAPINDVRVAQILVDEDQLWLPTTGRGLLNFKDGQVVNYSQELGINQTIAEHAILTGSTLWFSSNKELFKIDLKQNSFEIIDKSDGLKSIKNRDIVAFNGNVLVAQDDGIKVIDLAASFEETSEFSIIIDRLEGSDGYNYKGKPFDIPYSVGTLKMIFKALIFRNQPNLTYRYRLKQHETDTPPWSNSNINTVNYSKLNPGSYTFEVSARTKNSEWSPATTLPFTIVPAYWQTLWFKALILGIILMIAGLIYNSFTRNIRLKRKLENDRIAAEIKALKAQINPHFLFNALNSIQSFLLSNENELAEEYLVKYSKLMRRILDQSSLLTNHIHEELKTIQLYVDLEKYRSSNGFEFRTTIDPDVYEEQKIPSMILQPVIENAIWHGVHNRENGLIHLHVKREDEATLLIEVSDNGRGFDPDTTKSSSKGSGLVKDRLALLNQMEGIKSTFSVQTAVNQGTTVSIWVAGELN